MEDDDELSRLLIEPDTKRIAKYIHGCDYSMIRAVLEPDDFEKYCKVRDLIRAYKLRHKCT